MSVYTATYQHKDIDGVKLTITVEQNTQGWTASEVSIFLAGKASEVLTMLSGDDWADSWTLDSFGQDVA